MVLLDNNIFIYSAQAPCTHLRPLVSSPDNLNYETGKPCKTRCFTRFSGFILRGVYFSDWVPSKIYFVKTP